MGNIMEIYAYMYLYLNVKRYTCMKELAALLSKNGITFPATVEMKLQQLDFDGFFLLTELIVAAVV